MSEQRTFNEGDKVTVIFDGHEVPATVVYTPCATGDLWSFRSEDMNQLFSVNPNAASFTSIWERPAALEEAAREG